MTLIDCVTSTDISELSIIFSSWCSVTTKVSSQNLALLYFSLYKSKQQQQQQKTREKKPGILTALKNRFEHRPYWLAGSQLCLEQFLRCHSPSAIKINLLSVLPSSRTTRNGGDIANCPFGIHNKRQKAHRHGHYVSVTCQSPCHFVKIPKTVHYIFKL